MKVVHFSTSDLVGGADKAAYRIHHALRLAKCDSRLIVARKLSNDPTVVSATGVGAWGRIQLLMVDATRYAAAKRLFGAMTPFHLDFVGLQGSRWMKHLDGTQITHLHWVSGFLTSHHIRSIAENTRAPIVWTLMDIAPLTGGCHYTEGCSAFRNHCGRCPQLHSSVERDLSYFNWHRKVRNLRDLEITLVAPTQWVMDRIRESALFADKPIVKIPLPIDGQVFSPSDKRMARQALGWPENKRLIFFGASSMTERRKGFVYLHQALKVLAQRLTDNESFSRDQVELVIAGRGVSPDEYRSSFEAHDLGVIRDERTLALAYQSADLFVCPSIEDAGPMMINESLMCGCPVVAFRTGGAPDWIKTLETGYLVPQFDAQDLANGMYALLVASDQMPVIRRNCRQIAVKEFAQEAVSYKYAELYSTLLGASKDYRS